MDAGLRKLVDGMLSDDLDVEIEARERFIALCDRGKLGVEDALSLIEASAGPLPESEDRVSSPDHTVISAACEIVNRCVRDEAERDRVVGAIGRVFAGLSTDGKRMALIALAEIPTEASVRLYMESRRRHAEELAEETIDCYAPEALDPAVIGEERARGMAGALFPDLLDLADGWGDRYVMFRTLLDFLRAGLVDAGMLAGRDGMLVSELGACVKRMRRRKGEAVPLGMGWAYKTAHLDDREYSALLIDVAGWWGVAGVMDAVVALGDVRDPWVRAFRAVSMLRCGLDVSDEELAWLASFPRERWMLHSMLTEMGEEGRLPGMCRDEAKLAEGHMVDWLSFSTELGREPNEIELVKVVKRRSGVGMGRKGKPQKFYVFRFRVTDRHWSKKEGWMVGVATGGDGWTFSSFSKWGEKDLDEQVGELLDGEGEGG